MSEAAVILYGHPDKAGHDRIIENRSDLAQLMRERDVELRIARTFDPPQAADTLPQVEIANAPEYDVNGDLLPTTAFHPASLSDIPVVYDRWSENFNQTGSLGRAPGIGVENPINHFSVQNLGRDKRRMGQSVLEVLGLGIRPYTIDEAREFLVNNPGKKIFAKPNMGAWAEGVSEMSDPALLDTIDSDTILQEFCDTTAKLPFLRPYSSAHAESLEKVNVRGTEKEVRMYTFFTTLKDGSVHKAFWPILRTRAPHQGKIKANSIIRTAIDPETVPDEYYRHAEQCGKQIMSLTGVKHLYIATDLSHARTQLGEEKRVAIETNARSPGLWVHASGARRMFADQAAMIAHDS